MPLIYPHLSAAARTPCRYSNLRMIGGSNHLLLPTGVLGKLYPPAAEAAEVVRIEQCTSAWINSIYPGDITEQMAPKDRELLRAAGHVGTMFNGMKARILGPGPDDGGGERRPFAKFTVSALELRRLLTEARERGEVFRLTYTVLGSEGDERWRRTAPGRTVTLREDGLGSRQCSEHCGMMMMCACAPAELGLLPPPGYWPMKTLIQQPYPIIDGAERVEGEIPCFGP